MKSSTTLNIPSFLWSLHGKTPTRFELLFTYFVGIVAAVVSWFMYQSYAPTAPLWKSIVLVVVVVDLVAGVVANTSKSTSDFYGQKTFGPKFLFLVFHVIDVILLGLVFSVGWIYFACLFIYVLLAGSIVLVFKQVQYQRPIAIALAIEAIFIITMIFVLPKLLTWISIVFAIKLIYAFAVDHYQQA